jgi:potassium/hydrogen antiporter
MDSSALVPTAAAVLLLAGVLASKISSRLGIPALLLFLGLGMLAGSEGIGGIEFSDWEMARSVGVVALAFILFAGGLSTEWSTIRRVARAGVVLATAGVVITAVIAGLIATAVLDLSLKEGLLLGAIISSTDAAAVFAVLRSRNVSLRGDVRPVLELESGSNDPMALFLTVGLLVLLTEPDTSTWVLAPMFLQQLLVGGALGYLIARGAVVVLNRLRLESDGLYPVLTIALVLLTYGATTMLGGSGFLAVYVAGLVLGHRHFVHRNTIIRFHDAIAWLSQISMFLVLGLLVFPSGLGPIAVEALLISAALIFLARPLAVFVSLAVARFSFRERVMISWVGLRGAVPIILATFPLVEDIPQAELIFNVVFFIVLTSVLVQGTTIPLVADWLKVAAPAPADRPYPLEPGPHEADAAALREVHIPPGAAVDGSQLVEVGLPDEALVVLLRREGSFIVPQGSTVLRGDDRALVLAEPERFDAVKALLQQMAADTEAGGAPDGDGA